ncbi:hypothetical protein ACW9HQ_53675, partial [Nocardia gipuzkoensis]
MAEILLARPAGTMLMVTAEAGVVMGRNACGWPNVHGSKRLRASGEIGDGRPPRMERRPASGP